MEVASEASIVTSLGAPILDALEARIPGTRAHADSTAAYATGIAVQLGLDSSQAELVGEAARLHDAGTLYVREELAKTEPLNPAEVEELASHPDAAYRLLRGSGIPEEVCIWVAYQHERMDGRGRHGLAGEAVPLPARIIQVACDYAARAAQGSDPESVLQALREAAGSRLDPAVVEALATLVSRPPQPPEANYDSEPA
jgi:HD-GYP domain-containing protein (c-di-GMP phosphodiesterase class II)